MTTAAEPAGSARRPRSVYGVGAEPDARFSLANERTALAWVRTGLGLVAAGVALTSLALLTDLTPFLHVVAIASCLAGAVVAASALLGWQRTERALRLGEPLPAPRALAPLVLAVVVMGVVLAGHSVLAALR